MRTRIHDRSRLMCLCTQNVQIVPKFREENFRDQKSNHEIHENIVPRKFGALRYALQSVTVLIACDMWSLKPPELYKTDASMDGVQCTN